jgi:hypothetical protein
MLIFGQSGDIFLPIDSMVEELMNQDHRLSMGSFGFPHHFSPILGGWARSVRMAEARKARAAIRKAIR